MSDDAKALPPTLAAHLARLLLDLRSQGAGLITVLADKVDGKITKGRFILYKTAPNTPARQVLWLTDAPDIKAFIDDFLRTYEEQLEIMDKERICISLYPESGNISLYTYTVDLPPASPRNHQSSDIRLDIHFHPVPV